MRGKFGCAVVLLAVAAFVAIESQSYGGRRRGRCSSCYSCGPQGCAVPAAPGEASPSDAAAAQSAPAPLAQAPIAADAADSVASPSDKQSQSTPSIASRQSNNTYYYGRRFGRRRWYRR